MSLRVAAYERARTNRADGERALMVYASVAHRLHHDAITGAIGDHGVYAVFLLMLVDAVLPAASELVMVYAGALAAGAFAGKNVVLFGEPVESDVWAFVTSWRPARSATRSAPSAAGRSASTAAGPTSSGTGAGSTSAPSASSGPSAGSTAGATRPR